MKKVLSALIAFALMAASFTNISAAGSVTVLNERVTAESGVTYAVWDVEVYGEYVYGADAAFGLRIFKIGADNRLTDVTPDDAAYKGTMSTDSRNQLCVDNGLLYAAFSGDGGSFTGEDGQEVQYTQGIRVYDLTNNPAAPEFVRSNNWMGAVSSIAVDGDLVFAAKRDEFRIYSKLLNSSANSSVDFGGRTGQPAFGRNSEWAVQGDYAFYAYRPDATDGYDNYARVDIYDISKLRATAAAANNVDAKDVRYVTTLIAQTEYIEQGQIYSMYCSGDYLYIGAQKGIEVYDISKLSEGTAEFVNGYRKEDLRTSGTSELLNALVEDGYLVAGFYDACTVFARLDDDGSVIPVAELKNAGGEANQGARLIDGVFYAGARKDGVHSMTDITGVSFKQHIYNGVFTSPDFEIEGAAAGVDAVKVQVGNQEAEIVQVDADGCWSMPLSGQENGSYSVTATGIKDGAALETANDTASYRVGAVWVELDAESENFLQNGAAVKLTVHKDLEYKGNYMALAAGYDHNGALVGAARSGLYSTDAFEQADTQEITLALHADNIEKVKAFVWAEDMTPLAEAEESDEFVVAFVGDSITHRQNYTRAIETYYMTRYPNRNISFINKGINGDNFAGANNRFEWDILNTEWDALNGEFWSDNEKPDAMTVMLGMNDLGAWESWTDPDVSSPNNKDFRLNYYLQNAETFIKKALAEGIELTIITPQPVDAYEVLETDGAGNATDINVKAGRNEGLQLASDGLKALGGTYGVTVIDMFEETVKFIETVREANPTLASVLTDRSDVVHPTYNGGFVMGCIYAKEAAEAAGNAEEAAYVSNVVIDAAQNTLEKAYNASVTGLQATPDSVSYTYLANAFPMPVSDAYEHAEQEFGLSITEDINNEIIQVTGLEDGIYTVTVGESEIGQYTAEALSSGINIAALAENPAQVKAKQAYEKINEKAERELRYRYIAEVDSKYVRDQNAWGGIAMTDRTTATQEGFQAFYEKVKAYYVDLYDTNDDGIVDETDSTWGNYRWNLRLPHFYFGIADYTSDPDYYQYACKLDHAQTWSGLEALKAEARDLLTPQQYEVRITKAAA